MDITDTHRMNILEQCSNEFRLVGQSSAYMSNSYPRWDFWTPIKGRTHAKTLREAVDCYLLDCYQAWEDKQPGSGKRWLEGLE